MDFRLSFQIKSYLFREQIKVIFRYYSCGRFAFVDLSMSAIYLFTNPYRLCRKFLQKRGASNIYAYGETPLTTLEKMVRSFDVRPADRWLELGSGRGRACLWLSQYWGCQARGVEWIPAFVRRANWIKKLFSLKRAEFQKISIEKADFSWASVVFLYGTCMSDEEIQELLIPMEALTTGAKVITISEPLNHPSYCLVKTITVSFPWGETDAYLQVKG